MKPYAHLNIPFELITKKLQEFINERGFHSGKISKGAFLTGINPRETFKAIPELSTLFEMYELDNFLAMMIVSAPPVKENVTYPHTDVMPIEYKDSCIAINWPILNCDTTYTTFYKKKPDAAGKTGNLVNGLPYTFFDFNQVEETHRIKIDRPTAIRYDNIHAVINETEQYRYTASFRFSTNHWKLFEENYE